MLSDLSAQPMEITMLGVEGSSLLCTPLSPTSISTMLLQSLPGYAAEVLCQHSLAGLHAICISCGMPARPCRSSNFHIGPHAQCVLQDHAGTLHAPANMGTGKGT